MKANGTAAYQRQHKRGLTLPQLNAIDLLAGGKTDKAAAELLNLSPSCITKWRLYDPVFQAALNQRRAEVWEAGIDRLRSLIPKALDALADALESMNARNRLKAAAEILRLAQLPGGALVGGPTEADEIVRQIVERRRAQAHGGILEDLCNKEKGLPPFNQHIEEMWAELEARAAETDESPP